MKARASLRRDVAKDAWTDMRSIQLKGTSVRRLLILFSDSVRLTCAVALLVSGCVFRPNEKEFDEFPETRALRNAGIVFAVRGEQGAVASEITSLLSKHTVRNSARTDETGTHVVTVYLSEPEIPGERRVRRSAYMFTIGQAIAGKSCVQVKVTWSIQSRGIHEEAWSIREEDARYIPATWSDIRSQLASEGCVK